MKKNPTRYTKVVLIVTILAVMLTLGGIFVYYNFFRQNNANLIEAVPNDAVFIFQINDNEAFVKSTAHLSAPLNDWLSLDALAGFQSFLDKAAYRNSERAQLKVMISGHYDTTGTLAVLYAASMKSSIFTKLLKTLQIDSRNCTKYDDNEIYTFGTHYKKFYFCWHHNIFSVSENQTLLKKSLAQHKDVRNLLTDNNFQSIMEMVGKNDKQNWFLTDYAVFLTHFADNIAENYQSWFTFQSEHQWAAYQIRFTENEIKWAGYVQLPVSGQWTVSETAADVPSEAVPETPDYCVVDHAAPAYHFAVTRDSVTYRYCLLPADTVRFPFASLLPETFTADSCEKYKNAAIYRSARKAAEFTTWPAAVATDYFVEKEGCWIFSDTVAALQYYVDKMQSSATLMDNAAYRAVKNNMPQQYAFQWMYLFNSESARRNFFSVQGLTASAAQAISVFALSVTPAQGTLATTNLYIKF